MDKKNILDTIQMLDSENLDIRTVTMGISLLDCCDSDGAKSRQKIYDKIARLAENLVSKSNSITRKYGIPIINKRISVTPISLVAAASGEQNYVAYAKILDKVAKETGVDYIGGFSALVQKGLTDSDKILLNSLPEALQETDIVCSSVNVASSRAGINMDAVKLLGELIKKIAYNTRDKDSIGCAKLVVFANAIEDNPFMAGSFHGVSEAESIINIGISGPGVVSAALQKLKGAPLQEIAEEIKKISFKITRMGELVGREVAQLLGQRLGIVDLSLAPTPAIGDSIARIIQAIGIERVGGHGTTAALAMLNDAIKKGGVMASSHAGGLSGAFIPVSEDEGMIEAASQGWISFDKLEAMTSVCSVGLDMIAIPGDTAATTISAIIADEAAIGIINAKTTAVRLIPVVGKKIGDKVVFGDLLGEAPIMAISKLSSAEFINRGGFIPAPLHSFKN